MGKFVELTGPIKDGDPTMPMDPKYSIVWHCNLDNLGYNLSRMTTSTHQGTHMDAQRHFYYDGETIDQIPLERLIVKCIKADLTAKKPQEPITVEDLLPYEAKIDEGCSVLLHTGWDKVFPNPDFFGKFPYVTKELADWFVEKKVGLVGMDMPTPNGTDWSYVHLKMLGEKIVIVEGLNYMENLPTNEEFRFYTLPLRLDGRDGSPVRAFAELQ
ncbi:MAG: cyclase family protein [Lachnospiraceae bacterium]|jgi:kynurenine formamidase|nr:cyclase family protein [Lachnospiraceae bacterium]